jgi:hypothetical protein
MSSSRHGGERPWSFLGSSLWLHPLAHEDLSRWRAFLRRRDLVRAGDREAPLKPRGSGLGTLHGLTLVATDPMGAPAGVFHLREHDGEIALSFAVPAKEARVLREAIRLILAALPSHTRSTRVRVDGCTENLAQIGEAVRENDDTWILPLPLRDQTSPSHAR